MTDSRLANSITSLDTAVQSAKIPDFRGDDNTQYANSILGYAIVDGILKCSPALRNNYDDLLTEYESCAETLADQVERVSHAKFERRTSAMTFAKRRIRGLRKHKQQLEEVAGSLDHCCLHYDIHNLLTTVDTNEQYIELLNRLGRDLRQVITGIQLEEERLSPGYMIEMSAIYGVFHRFGR